MRNDEELAKRLLATWLGVPDTLFTPGDNPPDYVATLTTGQVIGVEITTAEAVTKSGGELVARRNLDEPILNLVEPLNRKFQNRIASNEHFLLYLKSSASAYNEIPRLAEAAIEALVADPAIQELQIVSKVGEDVGEIWRNRRNPGYPRCVGLAVMNESAPSLVEFQIDAMMGNVFASKERKMKRWTGEKWLVVYSHFILAEPERYVGAASKLSNWHSFGKVFLIVDKEIHLIFER